MNIAFKMMTNPSRDFATADDRYVATQLEQVLQWSKLGSFAEAMEAYLVAHVAKGENSWRPIA